MKRFWRSPGAGLAVLILLLIPGCLGESFTGPGPWVRSVSGLRYRDLAPGRGLTAVAGDRVTVNYEGFLEDGTRFDSTYDRGEPFVFRLGVAEVIAGLDEGVWHMRIGGKREMILPPALAYGERGAGSLIPPNATLRLVVDLVRIERTRPERAAPASAGPVPGAGVPDAGAPR